MSLSKKFRLKDKIRSLLYRSKYHYFKPGDEVLVRDFYGEPWKKAYFTGVDHLGYPHASCNKDCNCGRVWWFCVKEQYGTRIGDVDDFDNDGSLAYTMRHLYNEE